MLEKESIQGGAMPGGPAETSGPRVGGEGRGYFLEFVTIEKRKWRVWSTGIQRRNLVHCSYWQDYRGARGGETCAPSKGAERKKWRNPCLSLNNTTENPRKSARCLGITNRMGRNYSRSIQRKRVRGGNHFPPRPQALPFYNRLFKNRIEMIKKGGKLEEGRPITLKINWQWT